MIMGCQSKLIKPKKFKKQPKFSINEITTFNKFEGLLIEECKIVEDEATLTHLNHSPIESHLLDDFEDGDQEIKYCKEYNTAEMSKKSTRKLKLTKCEQFNDTNPFEVLIDNHEEEFKDILSRNIILKTPKQCLKKCRRCNFKKRTCVLDKSSCKAIKHQCFKCNKRGHYPQSHYCKADQRSKSSDKLKEELIFM